MKVLHIVLRLDIGGLEVFLLELIKNRTRAIEPYIICLEEKGALGEEFHDVPLLSLGKKPGIQLGIINQIIDFVKTNRIDLIHTHNDGPHFYGALAGCLSRVPVVHTRHGIHDVENRKRLWMDRFSSFLSAKVIGVSNDISNLYGNTIKVSRSKVITILNGVNTRIFTPHTVDRLKVLGVDIPKEALILGIVGRLAQVKDHKTLLDACHILKNRSKKYHLVVVGDGPLKLDLITYAQTLGIASNVTFTGERSDIAELMNAFDVFVLSSVSEGISVTLVEAMACGLPVVATDVGGNPEVVLDGKTGFLVPPQDPDAIAQKIIELLKRPNLRSTMGRAGRARAEEVFSIHKSVERYENLYKEVIGITQ